MKFTFVRQNIYQCVIEIKGSDSQLVEDQCDVTKSKMRHILQNKKAEINLKRRYSIWKKEKKSCLSLLS